MLGIGSAIAYIPLSINLPDHFQQLKERQASYASTEAWWLCEPVSQRADSDVVPPEPVPTLHPSDPVTFTQASPNMQYELCFAMDTPLISLNGALPLPKTSDTHPIGCVYLLPFPSGCLSQLYSVFLPLYQKSFCLQYLCTSL